MLSKTADYKCECAVLAADFGRPGVRRWKAPELRRPGGISRAAPRYSAGTTRWSRSPNGPRRRRDGHLRPPHRGHTIAAGLRGYVCLIQAVKMLGGSAVGSSGKIVGFLFSICVCSWGKCTSNRPCFCRKPSKQPSNKRAGKQAGIDEISRMTLYRLAFLHGHPWLLFLCLLGAQPRSGTNRGVYGTTPRTFCPPGSARDASSHAALGECHSAP